MPAAAAAASSVAMAVSAGPTRDRHSDRISSSSGHIDATLALSEYRQLHDCVDAVNATCRHSFQKSPPSSLQEFIMEGLRNLSKNVVGDDIDALPLDSL